MKSLLTFLLSVSALYLFAQPKLAKVDQSQFLLAFDSIITKLNELDIEGIDSPLEMHVYQIDYTFHSYKRHEYKKIYYFGRDSISQIFNNIPEIDDPDLLNNVLVTYSTTDRDRNNFTDFCKLNGFYQEGVYNRGRVIYPKNHVHFIMIYCNGQLQFGFAKFGLYRFNPSPVLQEEEYELINRILQDFFYGGGYRR